MSAHIPLYRRFTPSAAPRTHLFTAGLFWVVVGLMLTIKGQLLLLGTSLPVHLAITIAGTGAGLLKGRYVFDRVAGKIVGRILARQRKYCLGGLFSFRNWGLILCMIMLGRIVSWTPLPDIIKGAVYHTVGPGLLFSSRCMWRAWRTTLPGLF
jgi:hypothetical protein